MAMNSAEASKSLARTRQNRRVLLTRICCLRCFCCCLAFLVVPHMAIQKSGMTVPTSLITRAGERTNCIRTIFRRQLRRCQNIPPSLNDQTQLPKRIIINTSPSKNTVSPTINRMGLAHRGQFLQLDFHPQRTDGHHQAPAATTDYPGPAPRRAANPGWSSSPAPPKPRQTRQQRRTPNRSPARPASGDQHRARR